MLNKVMLIGRLGRDPEVRYSQSGGTIVNLSLATDESYTDRDGNKVDKAEWHRVTAFNRTAENCKNYLRKGSLVYVEGNLQTRKWQDQQGQERYITEIRAQRVVFLDRKADGQQQQGNEGFKNRPSGQSQPPSYHSQPPSFNDVQGSEQDSVPF